MHLPDRLWVTLFLVILHGLSISNTGSTRNSFILLLMCSLSSLWCYRLQAETSPAGRTPLIKQIQPVVQDGRIQVQHMRIPPGGVRENFILVISGPPCCIIPESVTNIVAVCCSIPAQHGGLRSHCMPLSPEMAQRRLGDHEVMKIKLNVGSLQFRTFRC